MKRVYEIDVMRFLAAVSVVFYHYLSLYPTDVGSKYGVIHIPYYLAKISRYGFLGVSLFFMISGFVIMYSAEGKTWKDFAISRFIRLYPTLWLGASLTFLFICLFGSPLGNYTFLQYLANLTLLHRFIFNQGHLDGSYWTLVVEFRFYLLIAVLIGINKLSYKNINTIMLGWSVFGVWQLFHGKHGNIDVNGCYFAAGIAFFYSMKDGLVFKNKMLLMVSLVLCLISAYLQNDESDLNRLVPPIVIFLFFSLFYFVVRGVVLPIPKSIMVIMGGVTYPLYLIHQHIGYTLLQNITNVDNYVVYAVSLAIIMMLVAVAINLIYEPKMTSYFRGLFNSKLA